MTGVQTCALPIYDDTKASFLDLYTKVDAGASVEQLLAPPQTEPEVVPANEPDEDIPF